MLPYDDNPWQTHCEDCHTQRGHHNCAVRKVDAWAARIAELEAEVERLRGENKRLVNDVRGLERFRDLRTRHNDEMERKQSAMNRALSALESGDYGSAFAALRNAL